MAFLPNNNNYRSYSNIFNTQSFEPLNNSPIFQPTTPIINNQIMTNPILPAQNVPTITLKRNNNFIAPMTHGNNMLEYSPNNIYLNQANIYLSQNLNYRIPGNNVYSSMTLNRIPLYSNLTARNGIGDANFLGEKAYYNRNTEVVPPIRFGGYPHKLYNSSLKPNNYMFRRKRSQKEIEAMERERKLKVNKMLEEMCIYGSGLRERIIHDKQRYPDKYIPTTVALNKETENPKLFALGLIASILEENNIETAIKNDKYVEKEEMIGKTQQEMQLEIAKKEQEEKDEKYSLQLLVNGLIGKKKFDLYFGINESRFTNILYNPKENYIFKETIKEKLSKDFNISKDEIVVTIPSINHAQLVFQKKEFDYISEETLKKDFKYDSNYPELTTIREIKQGLLVPGCILTSEQLDVNGDRTEWPKEGKRGGEEYDPPKGWIGIGLKVLDKYENDRWLDMYNLEGEWVVAYHGIGQNSKFVNQVPFQIYKSGFKVGYRQAHMDCEDSFHEGQKVGAGAYCTPLIKTAEEYAGISVFNGKKYKTVIMCRVKPSARRHCAKHKDSIEGNYWVVDGTPNEIRPYRILYKRVN